MKKSEEEGNNSEEKENPENEKSSEEGLEEEIKKEEQIIENEKFTEVLNPNTKTRAPVLDQIAIAPESPIISLEQGLQNTPGGKLKNGEEGTYLPQESEEDEEKKYISDMQNKGSSQQLDVTGRRLETRDTFQEAQTKILHQNFDTPQPQGEYKPAERAEIDQLGRNISTNPRMSEVKRADYVTK